MVPDHGAFCQGRARRRMMTDHADVLKGRRWSMAKARRPKKAKPVRDKARESRISMEIIADA